MRTATLAFVLVAACAATPATTPDRALPVPFNTIQQMDYRNRIPGHVSRATARALTRQECPRRLDAVISLCFAPSGALYSSRWLVPTEPLLQREIEQATRVFEINPYRVAGHPRAVCTAIKIVCMVNCLDERQREPRRVDVERQLHRPGIDPTPVKSAEGSQLHSGPLTPDDWGVRVSQ